MSGRRIPERRCVGCGLRAPRNELVRLRLRWDAGVPRVVPDEAAESSGRSVYLCPRTECLHMAIRRSRLNRAFRQPAQVDSEELERYWKSI